MSVSLNNNYINKIGKITNNININRIDDRNKQNNFNKIFENKLALKMSKHANQRLKSQGIDVDEKTLLRLTEAVEKAKQKGLKNDVLVLSNDIAYLINIKNNVVITAKDVHNLKDNIFTNIEGVLVI